MYSNSLPPHDTMMIRVTDPDLVSLLPIKFLNIGTPISISSAYFEENVEVLS